jgi:hypothetical protein
VRALAAAAIALAASCGGGSGRTADTDAATKAGRPDVRPLDDASADLRRPAVGACEQLHAEVPVRTSDGAATIAAVEIGPGACQSVDAPDCSPMNQPNRVTLRSCARLRIGFGAFCDVTFVSTTGARIPVHFEQRSTGVVAYQCEARPGMIVDVTSYVVTPASVELRFAEVDGGVDAGGDAAVDAR